MQCPNCGKEAINVNGKFVCLDCGVELTQEAGSSNSQSNDDSLKPQQDPVAEVLKAEQDADSAPESQGEVPPEVAQTAPVKPEAVEMAPQEEVRKPVEEAVVNDLKEKTVEVTSEGSYDFTEDSASKNEEAAPVEAVDAPVAEGVQQASDLAQPSPPDAKPEDYFQPNSFDIKDDPKVQSTEGLGSTPEPVQEPELTSPTEPVEPNVSELSQEPAVPTGAQEPSFADSPQANQGTSSDFDQSSNNGVGLDALLDQYSKPTGQGTPMESEVQSMEVAPTDSVAVPGVDNVQPAVPGVDASQASSAAQPVSPSGIPSVESVFGNEGNGQGVDQITDDANPSPVKRSSGKLWIVLAVVGGILLLGAAGFGVYYFLNSKDSNSTEQALDEVGINSLSEQVSAAMSEAGSASVRFKETIDYSNLSGSAKEGSTLTHENNGSWEVDADGNIYLSNAVNNSSNKQTYIKSADTTYELNQSTGEYSEEDRLQIVSFPVMYDISSKGSVLFSNNVLSVTKVQDEVRDGEAYSKYKVTPTGEYIKNIVGAGRSELSEEDFKEIDASNLSFFVYIDQSNRLAEVILEGSVSVESGNYAGSITLSSRGNYQYEEVVILDPAEEQEEEVAIISDLSEEVVSPEPEKDVAGVVDVRG